MNFTRFIPGSPLAQVLVTACVLLPASLFNAIPAASADTTYVWKESQAGCTGAGRGTWLKPYCSIQDALDASGSGAIIAVRPGTTDYLEAVKIDSDNSGSATTPTVLLARGTVVIDGSNKETTWTQESPSTIWSLPLSGTSSIGQVVASGVRYPVWDGSPWQNLPPGQCIYVATDNKVYVNRGTSSPAGPGYISIRRPIDVLANTSYVSIQGFWIRRSSKEGVLVRAPVNNITVAACDIRDCAAQGIEFTNTAVPAAASHHCTVRDNVSCTNSGHGITIHYNTTDFSILRNVSVENDDPILPRGGVKGILVGDGAPAFPAGTTPSRIHNHLVEGNKASGNEDSGIEFKSNFTVSRNNQSWANRDHGFDHLKCTNVTHIGDLSWGNWRDGMSFENDSYQHTVRNCIIANNGRDPCRNDWELEVFPHARDGWSSNFNVIWRDTSIEPADNVIINFDGGPQPIDCSAEQCTNPDSCFTSLAAFRIKWPNLEVNTKDTEPKFVNSGIGNFKARTSSPAIDAADTTLVGFWSPTDAAGFARYYDCRGVANTGLPVGAVADIGPYEHDDGAPIIAVSFGNDHLAVSWTARGEDGDVGTPDKHEVYVNGVVLHTDLNPPAPGTQVCVEITGLASCSPTNVKVKTTDHNGEVAESNTVVGSTACATAFAVCESYLGGGGGGGMRAKPVREEGELELTTIQPNPAQGPGVVRWSIPTIYAGAHLEVSLFDVAGRRVARIAEGPAVAGAAAQELTFQSDNGESLQSGVYFLRLRIADRNLRRTVVLSR